MGKHGVSLGGNSHATNTGGQRIEGLHLNGAHILEALRVAATCDTEVAFTHATRKVLLRQELSPLPSDSWLRC
jgi:hypothetical protein